MRGLKAVYTKTKQDKMWCFISGGHRRAAGGVWGKAGEHNQHLPATFRDF